MTMLNTIVAKTADQLRTLHLQSQLRGEKIMRKRSLTKVHRDNALAAEKANQEALRAAYWVITGSNLLMCRTSREWMPDDAFAAAYRDPPRRDMPRTRAQTFGEAMASTIPTERQR